MCCLSEKGHCFIVFQLLMIMRGETAVTLMMLLFFMRQCSSTHCCVPYGCEYVYGAESSQRIHRLQRSAKSLVEYVTNSGSAAPEK